MSHGPSVVGAVRMRLGEIPGRVLELPPASVEVRVAAVDERASEAVRVLTLLKRKPRLEPEFRFDDGPLMRLWDPNEFLLECLSEMTPGQAVDLGCGTGRDAVALALCGWEVTAVDRLPDALERGRHLAEVHGVSEHIQWVEAELRRYEPPPADLAFMAYCLERDTLRKPKAALKPGGHLVIEMFSVEHRNRFGKPRRPEGVLIDADMDELSEGMMVRHRSQDLRSPARHTARLWVTAP